jgi:hypothetical protein
VGGVRWRCSGPVVSGNVAALIGHKEKRRGGGGGGVGGRGEGAFDADVEVIDHEGEAPR